MASTRRDPRPAFLNPLRIRLPAPGVTSIAHRVSGLLLVLTVPALMLAFERSLDGPEGFAQVRGWLGAWPARAALVVLVWALAHHLLAGLRFLLMDLELGVALRPARASAWVVNVLGVLALLAAVGGLL